jgi:monoamine oxidase
MREARFDWPTHEWTQGSYLCSASRLASGRPSAAIGALAAGVQFVGEHASMERRGFMEGGCESGEGAAQSVLRALRIAAVPVSRRSLLVSTRSADAPAPHGRAPRHGRAARH